MPKFPSKPFMSFLTTTLLISSFFLLVSTSYSQTSSSSSCRDYSFPNGESYVSCLDLPVLDSFLHWNYTLSTSTADLAFRRPGTSPSQWISWAVNPSGGAMVGSQSLVAYLTSSGSVYAYTSSVESLDTDLPEGDLSFRVPSLSGAYTNGEMTIFASLQLGNALGSTANQVWQVGQMSSDGVPSVHPLTGANMQSVMILKLASNGTNGNGVSSGGGDGDGGGGRESAWTGAARYEQESRNVHGVLNAVSWGIMMPSGMMAARYLKVFKSADPAWFYLHTACQTSAYAVGLAGWVTGRRLGGSDATTIHGNIGLLLVLLGTLQVMALLIRPRPDHRLRVFWNVYHHSCGYIAITLSIVNVYIGLNLLDPQKIWRMVYTGVITIIGAIAVLMEAITWFVVIGRRRRRSKPDPYQFSSGFIGMNAVVHVNEYNGL